MLSNLLKNVRNTCLGIFSYAKFTELFVVTIYPIHRKIRLGAKSTAAQALEPWKIGFRNNLLAHPMFLFLTRVLEFRIRVNSDFFFKSHKAKSLFLAKLSSVQVWFSSMDPDCQECWLCLVLH